MKLCTSSFLSFALTAVATAQGTTPTKSDPTSTPIIPVGQLVTIDCNHDLKTKTLQLMLEGKKGEIKKAINISHLSAVKVHFTGINTFSYQYDAAVTGETAFYSASAPSALKNYIQGSIPQITVPGNKDSDKAPFAGDYTKFKQDFEACADLTGVATKIQKIFKEFIVKENDNSAIRTDVKNAVAALLRSTSNPTSIISGQDLLERQSQLKAALPQLSADLDQIRKDRLKEIASNPNDNATDHDNLLKFAYQTLTSVQKTIDLLGSEATTLDAVNTAPDTLDKVVVLDQKADQYTITISATQVDDNGNPATDKSTSLQSTVVIDIVRKMTLDFGTGVVYSSKSNKDYFLTSSGGAKVVMSGGSQTSFVPAAFAYLYERPSPRSISLGGAFGVDISTGQNFYFGLVAINGGTPRFGLTFGVSLNKLTVLNGDTVGQPVVNGASIQTKVRYQPGFFIGLTYNFGGM